MPLLSALPFDPCLMRVLDHQYSNYFTWKRGKSLFRFSWFSQCKPKYIINAKLPDALPLLSFLLVCDTHLKIFYNSNLLQLLCTDFLCDHYYFPPSSSVHFQRCFSKLCIICFTQALHLFCHHLPTDTHIVYHILCISLRLFRLTQSFLDIWLLHVTGQTNNNKEK